MNDIKIKNPTLIDRLGEIVEEIHLDEVKSIINTLTHINTFKHKIEGDLCEKNLYNTIITQLKKEFDIDTLQISLITQKANHILHKQGRKEELRCIFSNKVSNNDYIEIKYCCKKLTDYQKLTLNTYFRELVHLLYIQYVLSSFHKTTTTDPLTKLTNRLAFNQEMKTLIPLALREKMNLGLLLINIDRFRAVNDEHGNQFGDEFLKLYANTIKSTVRSSDIVVRFGGGEFLVLLINVDTEERTLQLAEKIQDRLAQSYLVLPNGDKFKKTVCIGISMFPKDSTEINTIIRNADIALSDAKDQGRSKILRFTQNDESTIELF